MLFVNSLTSVAKMISVTVLTYTISLKMNHYLYIFKKLFISECRGGGSDSNSQNLALEIELRFLQPVSERFGNMILITKNKNN